MRSGRSGRPTAGGWSMTSVRDTSTFALEGGVGTPSRWNTLRALRVLG